MVTVKTECQSCEEKQTMEVDGVIIIYRDKNGDYSCYSHEVSQAEILGMLDLVRAQILKETEV